MISRAARVPRICLACRFGLTQRSAILSFRGTFVRDGLGQRRRFASDIGKVGEIRTETFISDRKTTSDATARDEPTEAEQAEPVVESEESTPPTYETTPESRISQEQDEDAKSTSATPSDAISSTEPSSNKPIDPEQAVLDQLLDEVLTPPTFLEIRQLKEGPLRNQGADWTDSSMFELPDLQEPEEFTLPKKRFRHDLVHDQALGVSALGAPADAIIINNPNQMRTAKKPPTVLEPQPIKPPTDVDWQHLAPEPAAEQPATQEVNANIDELRPDTRILRMSEVEKLVQALCDGFTIDQLRDYNRSHQLEETEDVDTANYSWVEEHMPWTPLTPFKIQGQDKVATAQRIVLQKWKIEIQEQVDGLGMAFIQIDPELFPLLTHGSNDGSSVIWDLRRDFLVDDSEKISQTAKLNRINITARKATTYGILAHLDQIFQRLQTRIIPIRSYRRTLLSIAELNELGRITKTTLNFVKDDHEQKIKVAWLPEPGENVAEKPQTEDLGDIVLRLLHDHSPVSTHTHIQCIPPLEPENDGSAAFVEVHRQSRALAWKDKLRRLLRVTSPISKSTETITTPLELSKAVPLPEYSITKPGKSNNKNNIRISTTATFGHILHREAFTSMAILVRAPRILSPTMPHPASFSALKPDDGKPMTQSTTIILNLAPHVVHTTAEEKQGPAIRIHLPVDAEADLANFTIPKGANAHCVVPWHVNDVMLPRENVDVRLAHQRLLPLDISQPGLKEFLETSEFNLLKGHLRTPSQTTVSLSKSWLNRRLGDRKSATEVDVLYAFRGLEIHQTIEMPWRGHTLRYSSIEAGQHGGQRQELTLQPGSPSDPGTSFQADKRESFLQLVEDVATGQCFSWTEGFKSIKHRQLEDYSYDLPEEELSEDIIVDHDKFDKHGRLNLTRYEQQEEEFPDEDDYMPRRRSKGRARGEKPVGTLEDIEAMLEREPEPAESSKTADPDISLDDFSSSPKTPKADKSQAAVDDIFASMFTTKATDDSKPPRKKSDRLGSPSSPKGPKPPKADKSQTAVGGDIFARKSTAKATDDSKPPRKTSDGHGSLDDSSPKGSQAAKSDDDIFASKFAARATHESRRPRKSDGLGFFDDDPKQAKAKKAAVRKKPTKASKRKSPSRGKTNRHSMYSDMLNGNVRRS